MIKFFAEEKIISSGDKLRDLLIVLEGEASVIRENSQVATLKRGQFIGEISFLTEQPASADVYAKGNLKYIKWAIKG